MCVWLFWLLLPSLGLWRPFLGSREIGLWLLLLRFVAQRLLQWKTRSRIGSRDYWGVSASLLFDRGSSVSGIPKRSSPFVFFGGNLRLGLCFRAIPSRDAFRRVEIVQLSRRRIHVLAPSRRKWRRCFRFLLVGLCLWSRFRLLVVSIACSLTLPASLVRLLLLLMLLLLPIVVSSWIGTRACSTLRLPKAPGRRGRKEQEATRESHFLFFTRKNWNRTIINAVFLSLSLSFKFVRTRLLQLLSCQRLLVGCVCAEQWSTPTTATR